MLIVELILLKFLGAIYCVAFLLFFLLTLPLTFIIRWIVVHLAKSLRPDLDEILGGLNVMFVCDLLAKTPPRSNVVLTSVFKNQLTHEEFKSTVMKRWFSSSNYRQGYKRLQQYPVKWLGFCFWKNAFDTFSIDNHVHKLSGTETVICEEQLNQSIEKLLNSSLPKCQSPWEFYVIENYQQGGETQASAQSVVLCKYHHTLADGFSGMSAISKLFDEQFQNQFNFLSDKNQTQKKNFFHRLQFFIMSPINTIFEGIDFFSNIFTTCSWKVADKKKEWHQFVVRAEPIPLERIKHIKNTFGVSFTSVLLSAVSASIYKYSKQHKDFGEGQDLVSCLSVLPIPSRSQNETLNNQMASAFLEIPSTFYGTPVERLCAVDKMLVCKKHSVFPYLSQILPKFIGTYMLPVSRSIFFNKNTAFALTNVPGLPGKFELNGNPIIDNGFQLGGAPGVTGVTISAMSHHQNFRIAISVEKGLMSRDQAQQFIDGVIEEIQLLQNAADKKNNN